VVGAPDYRIEEIEPTRRDFNEIAVVSSRAFYRDPFYRFLSNEPRLVTVGLERFFVAMVRHLGRGRRVWVARNEANEVCAVAAWLPTHRYPPSVVTQVAQVPGILRALYRRPVALLRGEAYLRAIAATHPREPHWYLFLLVTDPEDQRRGLGRRLMETALTHIDDEKVGAHLETQKFENVAYYRQFGFELTSEVRPHAYGPPLYSMWRSSR
jgi:ribosomal protein S18 acetylase RimI-like enzyme